MPGNDVTLVSISKETHEKVKDHIEKPENKLKYSSMRQFIDIASENQMQND